MDFDDAVQQRKSIRAFLDRPVKRALIEEVLTLALRSPSWGNTQPWEIAVAGGEKARELTQEFSGQLLAGEKAEPDFCMPENFPGIYNERYKAIGRDVFRLKGIGRDDQDARLNHYVNNFKAFGAPVLIYILIDESLETVYPVFDAGLLAAHLTLAAASRGLGTCLLAALAWYPNSVRKHLQLPPGKKIVLGIALGYPDPDDPVNTLHSEREPLSRVAGWYGLEDDE